MDTRKTGIAPATARQRQRALSLGLCVAALSLLSSTASAQSTSTTSTTKPRTTTLLPTQSTTNSAPASGLRGARATTSGTTDTTAGTTATTTSTDASETDDAAATTDPTATGSLRPGEEPLAPGELDDTSDLRRTNLRGTPLDERLPRRAEETETPGIPLGTFTLRPSLSQSLATEQTRSGATRERRTYTETGLKGVLSSDWSRHQLIVTGEGKWQRNLSGDSATKPSASIKGDLRLDLSRDMIARITAGYDFSREDTDDPNAISGAKQQSGIHRFSGGLALERDLGILRGTVAVDAERYQYSDVQLTNGNVLSLKDRDRISGTLRGRVGYEISPALIPFVEASIGRVEYDRGLDTAGYARSGDIYGAKGGVAVDLGDKLKGELGLGYKRQIFEDGRLADLEAVAAEGTLAWSPQRGTDISLGLATTLEPSTTAGENGYISRALTAALSHQLRTDLVARLTGSTKWNDYSGASAANDSTTYATGAGLSYGLNRYIDLTADLGYEYTSRKTGSDTQVLRAGIGITTKR
ncbi:outer membrane beta-barrel protein [Rhizobium sp. RU36D]|uniref:outer membrane beta-barrel protein n=1 Tax=Rhizobium sp. RU36D TaxID=1907415 RepID=UPI0009D8EAC4|nr:outer membrane beta-barrel protein [Rhizobium sp. RU36D]SMC42514.1 hypothetical protein SAMN05880593_101228 [Rhizobium sp. RU36D]